MNLLKISFTITILGIFTLLILTNTLQPPLKTISQITLKDLNKKITLNTQITNIKNIDQYKFSILSLKDQTGQINATINYNSQKPHTPLNQPLTITGKVTQYNQQLQIQINKITIR